jgi:hypothetical protein
LEYSHFSVSISLWISGSLEGRDKGVKVVHLDKNGEICSLEDLYERSNSANLSPLVDPSIDCWVGAVKGSSETDDARVTRLLECRFECHYAKTFRLITGCKALEVLNLIRGQRADLSAESREFDGDVIEGRGRYFEIWTVPSPNATISVARERESDALLSEVNKDILIICIRRDEPPIPFFRRVGDQQ